MLKSQTRSKLNHKQDQNSSNECDCQWSLNSTKISIAAFGDFALLTLTAHNWQRWKKSIFLTCPRHEIVRDEDVGLKSCKYT